MSWDSYRDNLIASGVVKQAAIVGHEGGVWTASPGLNITPAEVNALIGGFANSASLANNGVRIGGTKFMFIQADDTQIQGKSGATGVSVAKAGKCLVIGLYGDGQQPGACRATVEKIRDYLVTSGY